MTPLSLAAVAATSSAVLLTELALTRIVSVVMYYHFAFLAISIALFGLSASGVYAYLRRKRLERVPTEMNWGFRVTFLAGSLAYVVALVSLMAATNGLQSEE